MAELPIDLMMAKMPLISAQLQFDVSDKYLELSLIHYLYNLFTIILVLGGDRNYCSHSAAGSERILLSN